MEPADSPGRSGSSHRSLIRQAAEGDPDGWRRMAAIFGPMIYAWLRKAGLDPHDAADVAQEVLRTVYQRIGEFQPHGQGGFRTWLRAIARNKVGDFLRRQGRQVPTIELPPDEALAADDTDDESSQTQASERDGIVRRACLAIQHDFAPRIWQAFWRSVVDQHPTDQVAADLQMSPHAVRQARYRVLRRLREELDGLLD